MGNAHSRRVRLSKTLVTSINTLAGQLSPMPFQHKDTQHTQSALRKGAMPKSKQKKRNTSTSNPNDGDSDNSEADLSNDHNERTPSALEGTHTALPTDQPAHELTTTQRNRQNFRSSYPPSSKIVRDINTSSYTQLPPLQGYDNDFEMDKDIQISLTNIIFTPLQNKNEDRIYLEDQPESCLPLHDLQTLRTIPFTALLADKNSEWPKLFQFLNFDLINYPRQIDGHTLTLGLTQWFKPTDAILIASKILTIEKTNPRRYRPPYGQYQPFQPRPPRPQFRPRHRQQDESIASAMPVLFHYFGKSVPIFIFLALIVTQTVHCITMDQPYFQSLGKLHLVHTTINTTIQVPTDLILLFNKALFDDIQTIYDNTIAYKTQLIAIRDNLQQFRTNDTATHVQNFLINQDKISHENCTSFCDTNNLQIPTISELKLIQKPKNEFIWLGISKTPTSAIIYSKLYNETSLATFDKNLYWLFRHEKVKITEGTAQFLTSNARLYLKGAYNPAINRIRIAPSDQPETCYCLAMPLLKFDFSLANIAIEDAITAQNTHLTLLSNINNTLHSWSINLHDSLTTLQTDTNQSRYKRNVFDYILNPFGIATSSQISREDTKLMTTIQQQYTIKQYLNDTSRQTKIYRQHLQTVFHRVLQNLKTQTNKQLVDHITTISLKSTLTTLNDIQDLSFHLNQFIEEVKDIQHILHNDLPWTIADEGHILTQSIQRIKTTKTKDGFQVFFLFATSFENYDIYKHVPLPYAISPNRTFTYLVPEYLVIHQNNKNSFTTISPTHIHGIHPNYYTYHLDPLHSKPTTCIEALANKLDIDQIDPKTTSLCFYYAHISPRPIYEIITSIPDMLYLFHSSPINTIVDCIDGRKAIDNAAGIHKFYIPSHCTITVNETNININHIKISQQPPMIKHSIDIAAYIHHHTINKDNSTASLAKTQSLLQQNYAEIDHATNLVQHSYWTTILNNHPEAIAVTTVGSTFFSIILIILCLCICKVPRTMCFDCIERCCTLCNTVNNTLGNNQPHQNDQRNGQNANQGQQIHLSAINDTTSTNSAQPPTPNRDLNLSLNTSDMSSNSNPTSVNRSQDTTMFSVTDTANTTLDSEQLAINHHHPQSTPPNTSNQLQPTHHSTPQRGYYNIPPPNTAFIQDTRAPILNIMGFDDLTQSVKIHFPCHHEGVPPGGNMFDYTKHSGFTPITAQCSDKTCFVNGISQKFLTSKDLSILLAKLSRNNPPFTPNVFQYFHNSQFPPTN